MLQRYRHRNLVWGTTPAEAAAAMPGDELTRGAGFVATRALTVAAPPEDVFGWIAQAGVGRAGFYSYDLIDNRGRRSATRLLPQFQHPQVGDLAAPMRPRPGERTSFRVAAVDEPHLLLWANPGCSWVWQLTPVGSGHTRLVTRMRQQCPPGPLGELLRLALELGDFPMMRKMLLTIRSRAELAEGSPT